MKKLKSQIPDYVCWKRNPKKMSDYPQNTKKGEQTKRYKAVYNQKALRLGQAVREKTAEKQLSTATAAAPVPAKATKAKKGK